MGRLSFRLKSNFLDLLKCINSLNWFIVLFSLINLSVCIYEDQIGKFDWRQSYVGRIKFAQFDTVSTAKKIIVATEENVLAALHLKTGQVVWRHVLETASSGDFQLLHVTDKVVTVTGANPYLVRGWDTATGVLLWEWSLSLNTEDPELSEWWIEDQLLVHMLPVFGSHIEVTTYNVLTGQNRGATSRLPALWANEGCVLARPYYACLSGSPGSQLLLSVDVTAPAVRIISQPISDYMEAGHYELSPFDGNSVLPGFLVNDKVFLIKDSQYDVMKLNLADYASVTVADSANGPLLMQAWHDSDGFSLTAYSAGTSAPVPAVHTLSRRDLRVPAPRLAAAACARHEPHACRILVAAEDDSVTLLQQGGRVLWSREEALASVAAVLFVDLPVSDLDAAIESEFDQKEAAKMYSSIWAAFSRRLSTQAQQLRTLLQSYQQDGGSEEASRHPYRDYFNLHKIIVLVTDAGKIFGMDNLSGEILWRRYEPALDTAGVAIYQRRSARHPPLDACVTIVGKHEETGNGLLITLNPITGKPLAERALRLDSRVLQAALLHTADEEKLHALIVLDGEENVQVFPQSAARLVENFYMYVADRETATVRGYSLKYDGQSVVAHRTYTLHLGGRPDAGHRIAAIAAKYPSERVHSPGKVLGDRSVLYKYTNPNLALFVTEGPDALHKVVVVATFVDVVSGAVAAAQAHRRARATPHAVHSDNFAAYVYYSDKLRRTEIATLELYEGAQRWLPAGVPFSSLSSAGAPIVERQSYIASATITAAALTRTERSLTDKHLIMALTSGAILEIPWSYLEPRRPVAPTPEQREEGLLPYAPELPLPAEAVLNYNRSVARVAALHTAPAGLESTCLVLATGLDLFYTRVAPSKTFDLLKDDFDYYLITIVLAALVAATYSTKYFSSRKLLRNAWK